MYRDVTPSQVKAWIDKHFDHKPKEGGRNWAICSPFDDDDGYNFEINIAAGSPYPTHSWHGDTWAGAVNPRTGKRNRTFLHFVCRYLNCNYAQAVRAVVEAGGSDGVDDWQSWVGRRQSAVVETPVVDVALPDGAVPIAGTGRAAVIVLEWLRSRGLDEAEVARCHLHQCGTDIIFPYYEFDRLVYWQSRSLVNKEFRFPPASCGVSKGEFWYGFDDVEPASYLVITEAIFGTLTLGAQCLASGGADLAPPQVRKLRLFGPSDGVILAPDNDSAGVKSVVRNGQLLQAAGFQVFYSLPPAISYVDNDGRQKVTKDWNEAYTKLGWTKPTIRAAFENTVRPLDAHAMFELLRL